MKYLVLLASNLSVLPKKLQCNLLPRKYSCILSINHYSSQECHDPKSGGNGDLSMTWLAEVFSTHQNPILITF